MIMVFKFYFNIFFCLKKFFRTNLRLKFWKYYIVIINNTIYNNKKTGHFLKNIKKVA